MAYALTFVAGFVCGGVFGVFLLALFVGGSAFKGHHAAPTPPDVNAQNRS